MEVEIGVAHFMMFVLEDVLVRLEEMKGEKVLHVLWAAIGMTLNCKNTELVHYIYSLVSLGNMLLLDTCTQRAMWSRVEIRNLPRCTGRRGPVHIKGS